MGGKQGSEENIFLYSLISGMMCVGLEYGSLETVGPRTEHKKLAPSLWRDSFEVNACYIMKLKPFKNRRMGAVWHFGL
jgi:hypothetical protein